MDWREWKLQKLLVCPSHCGIHPITSEYKSTYCEPPTLIYYMFLLLSITDSPMASQTDQSDFFKKNPFSFSSSSCLPSQGFAMHFWENRRLFSHWTCCFFSSSLVRELSMYMLSPITNWCWNNWRGLCRSCRIPGAVPIARFLRANTRLQLLWGKAGNLGCLGKWWWNNPRNCFLTWHHFG